MRTVHTVYGVLMIVTFAFAAGLGAQHTQTSPWKSKTGDATAAETREPGLYITFNTEKGSITCKLYEKETPLTVRTIGGLATGKTTGKPFYDGLMFHRVIPDFMIQGGDPLGTGMGGPKGPGFPFKDEFVPTLKFDVPGRLAMANSGPNTNGSQFFITDGPTPWLNNKHTIFGQCGNKDVVRAIARVPRDRDDKPRTPIHMQHVTVERVGPAPANAPVAGRNAPAKPPAKKSS